MNKQMNEWKPSQKGKGYQLKCHYPEGKRVNQLFPME